MERKHIIIEYGGISLKSVLLITFSIVFIVAALITVIALLCV